MPGVKNYTYHTILYYTIQYYTILYYTILHYTRLYYTLLYYTILYYTILFSTIPFFSILYYAVLYYTMLLVLSLAGHPNFCSIGASLIARATGLLNSCAHGPAAGKLRRIRQLRGCERTPETGLLTIFVVI